MYTAYGGPLVDYSQWYSMLIQMVYAALYKSNNLIMELACICICVWYIYVKNNLHWHWNVNMLTTLSHREEINVTPILQGEKYQHIDFPFSESCFRNYDYQILFFVKAELYDKFIKFL